MTFDPKKGDLWTTENGGRSFDEINHVERGFNGGWVQVMGPLDRVQEFKRLRSAWASAQTGPMACSSCGSCRPASRVSPGGEETAVRRPRVSLSRPRVQLEASGAPGCARFHRRYRARRAVRRRPHRRFSRKSRSERGSPLSLPSERGPQPFRVRRRSPEGQSG